MFKGFNDESVIRSTKTREVKKIKKIKKSLPSTASPVLINGSLSFAP